VDGDGEGIELAPRDRRALWSWVPGAVAMLGLAFGAFDVFVVRPEMQAVASSGRPVVGEVLSVAHGIPGQSARAVVPQLNHGTIGVLDAEIGWQIVDGGAEGRLGERVPLLCSTPLHRCERAARVAAYTAAWSVTPGVIRALALLALAAAMALIVRRRPAWLSPRARPSL